MKRPRRTAPKPAVGWIPAAIAGAVGIAVAQPLYDVLRRAPAFFVAHQADGWDVVLLCLALSIALPLALALPAMIASRLHPRLGRLAAAAALALCGGALGAAIARRFDLAPPLAIGLALAAVAATVVLTRSAAVVRGLGMLGVGTVVFPALLLSSAEIRALFPEPSDEAAGARSGEGAMPPVILVVLDELPLLSLTDGERRLDAGRFPHFARLAATSTWYREATTVAQSTVYSVPSILTGRYPIERRRLAPTVRDYRRNLFTILGRDFAFSNWETSTRLCPERLCRQSDEWTIARRHRLPAMLLDLTALYVHQIAPRAWSASLPTVDEQWRDFWGVHDSRGGERPGSQADRTSRPADLFAWFLNSLGDDRAKPAVHFLHVMLPHQPWHWLPDGRRYPTHDRQPHGLLNQRWRGSEWEVTQAHQRHLLTVGFVDRLVGELLRTLGRRDLLHDALLIVTSDHGATFETGSLRRNLATDPVDSIVNVPLFVKLPGQRAGSVDDRNAELIDILPTILAVLGVNPPPEIDGTSLLAPPATKGPIKRTYRTGNPELGSGGSPIVYGVGGTTGREAAAAEQRRRFGAGSWDAVLSIGPRPELHRVAVAALPAAEVAAAGARIVGLDRLAAVDPTADSLPVQVAGYLEDSQGAATAALAVALNGTIRCTTETFSSGSGEQAFTALLPPTALRRGANRLEIFRIDGPEGSPQLRSLPLTAHRGDDE